MLNPRFNELGPSPFQRLDQLLAGIAPGAEPIFMSLGEPQHPYPDFVADSLYENRHLYGKYPPLGGTAEFRQAAADWLARRFKLPPGLIDEARHIVALSGTREGLFMMPQVVVPEEIAGRRPAVLMPSPFYHAYAGAAVACGAEPVYLPCARANNFLPDLDSLPADLLERTAVFYLCSPTNPQGTAADAGYFAHLVALARTHDFALLIDECYADLYDGEPPTGALEICARDGDLSNVLVFHSASKRSSVPGLRSGFVAGDPDLISRFRTLRSYGGAVMPLPVLAASAALWRDDDHAAANRALYREKFDIAERILGQDLGFYRPQAGFFLWLDVGDGEDATRRLWREAGIKVMPGGYLARETAGSNPGQPYIRVALVQDAATTERALSALAETLAEQPAQASL